MSVDQYLNFKLSEIQVQDEMSHPFMMSVKSCFIRGSVVRYISITPDDVDTILLQDAARKEAALSSTNTASSVTIH